MPMWLLFAWGLLADGALIAHQGNQGHAQCSYSAIYPEQYVAYKTTQLSPESLTGNLSREVWQEVAWTKDFVDISTHTTPALQTRAKIRWDDSFLYVAAELEEPKPWATLREHDSVIFHDNDFEVFVDANATTHYYKEFEMNAFNTTWMLVLNKPYNDGGYENSTRVFPNGWTMQPPLRSVASVVPPDALNNPSKQGNHWTVEIAMPLASLVQETGAALPQPSTFWRINFSRVQWHLKVNPATGKYEKNASCQSCPSPGSPNEDNWVWSPQYEIAMHLPERWGILQFEDSMETGASYYQEWPSRSAAMAIYYAQHAYASDHGGNYTAVLAELLPYSSDPFPICSEAETFITASGGEHSFFEARVTSPAAPQYTATVRNDRFLVVAAS